MRKDIYVTPIRMSEALHERVMRIAGETGDSMNGTMLHLLAMGLKFYEAPITVSSERPPQQS